MASKSLRGIVLIVVICQVHLGFGINERDQITTNSWSTIQSKVTLRLFTALKFEENRSGDEIWNTMGDDIDCTINKDGSVHIRVPAGFDASKPLKLVTHGFASTITGSKTLFVDAFMKKYNKKVNVILVDWSNLAKFSKIYDNAAFNAIDVGNYVGQCMFAVNALTKIPGENMHFIGHSLGAHLVGKAGRVYKDMTGTSVGRITGLDPAGPRFINGPIKRYKEELYRNRINPNSARFVDIIHTCGSFTPAAVTSPYKLGDLNQLGHMDFYPNGGEFQPGDCVQEDTKALKWGKCSHSRAINYFYWSILDEGLFPAVACEPGITAYCQKSGSRASAYMGNVAQAWYSGVPYQRYYVDVPNYVWDMKQ